MQIDTIELRKPAVRGRNVINIEVQVTRQPIKQTYYTQTTMNRIFVILCNILPLL